MFHDVFKTQQHTKKQKPPARVPLVKLTLWVNSLVKAEIQRIAEREGLSISKVGAAALEAWVHQSIYRQHDAMLFPMLRQVMREELRAFGNRIVFFLLRIAFAAEQARILITKVLDRILRREGVTDAGFRKLLDDSNTLAQRNIIKKTEQMKTLFDEWEASFQTARQEKN